MTHWHHLVTLSRTWTHANAAAVLLTATLYNSIMLYLTRRGVHPDAPFPNPYYQMSFFALNVPKIAFAAGTSPWTPLGAHIASPDYLRGMEGARTEKEGGRRRSKMGEKVGKLGKGSWDGMGKCVSSFQIVSIHISWPVSLVELRLDFIFFWINILRTCSVQYFSLLTTV